MIPNPIRKVLSSMPGRRVQILPSSDKLNGVCGFSGVKACSPELGNYAAPNESYIH